MKLLLKLPESEELAIDEIEETEEVDRKRRK